MSGEATIFLLVNAIALLMLPRRFAPMPFLVGACYMTLGQGVKAGPFTFSILRILVLVGVVRVVIRGERLSGRFNAVDWLMIAWSVWAATSGLLHNDPGASLVNRLGQVYNACGIYFLLRVFCQSVSDVASLCRLTGILLLPVALEMLGESITGLNLFSSLGGVPVIPDVRNGRVRAQGPFSHAILAGTVGAVSLPLMVGIWRLYFKEAVVGLVACIIMIITSASSGPIMSALVGIAGLLMWQYRERMRLVRWAAILGYVGMDIVMKAPAYFLLARIDLTGSSTGWHRAELIRQGLTHFSEWWLYGTDYTRHWMPTGVPWSKNHTDITNHYLALGVDGGLLLTVLFCVILVKGFSFVGRVLDREDELPPESVFMVWALGVSLFAHAATFVTVCYFDQSIVFFYISLATVASSWSAVTTGNSEDGE